MERRRERERKSEKTLAATARAREREREREKKKKKKKKKLNELLVSALFPTFFFHASVLFLFLLFSFYLLLATLASGSLEIQVRPQV